MNCSLGSELRQQYERAEKEKVAASINHLPSTNRKAASQREFTAVRQRYVESYSNWLGHKAFCHDCKPHS